MNLLRLALRFLLRDWRSGEWRVLMLALVLAVGSLATVGLFADRVRQALLTQTTSLIGADLRITSTRPFSPGYRQMAEARGLRVVLSRSFPSMVSHGGQVLLTEIQLLEAGYPLRGKIEIDAGGAVHTAHEIPQRGVVWVDERLMRRLDLSIGDEVGVGARRFKVAARIVKDIDQSVGFASFAPRLLLNDADAAETGLLQEGSRITYRLMIAGEAAQVSALRLRLQEKLSGNEKLEDVTDARPEIRTVLERAEHLLGLAALTNAILAGVAILLAARRYVVRHLDGCAVMRCLGAGQGQVLRLYWYQFLLAGSVAVLAGLLLGFVVQAVLVARLMTDASLPQPGAEPLFKAAITGFALLLGFAFLPLLQLGKVSPLRVLRRELGAPQVSGWLIYGLAAWVLAGLFLWQAGSLKLGLSVLAALLGGLLVAGGVTWWLLQVLARCAVSSLLKHALSNLARQGRSVALQVAALSLGGMALLVLTLVRGDLLASWQDKLPSDAPNRFVVSIQPDQYQPVLDFFARQNIPAPLLLPMVRGRLVAINGRAVSGDQFPDPRARSLVEREFNLSYGERLPQWNELVGGRWWSQTERAQLSVEEGIAKTLGIHMGDELSYDVSGSRFSARVSSLRRVQWDSMRVNFFVITTPELLRDYPVSYLTSFYLSSDKVRVGDEMVREFPNLLVIDTGVVLAQVRGIIDQVAQAVSGLFLFTLVCGLLVLYAVFLSTQDERMQEAAILRTMGAQSRYLARLHLYEFAITGLMAGLFAAGEAALLGWVLARFVLDIPGGADGAIWLAGVAGGLILVVLAGWISTRRLRKISAMSLLRGV